MFAKVHHFLIEFSSSTTVHGINYFGDHKRHWIERVFWIVVFVVSMSACIFTVHETYEKWQNSPIIVTQDDKLTAISEIPFPAVTVCPTAKINDIWPVNLTKTQDLLTNTAREMFFSGAIPSVNAFGDFKFNQDELKAMNITEKELLLLEAVSHICPESFKYKQDFAEHRLNPFDAVEILQKHALGLDDMFYYQSLKGDSKADLFERVFTEEGVCYTFNSLKNFDIFNKNSIAEDFRPYESQTSAIDWNPENGYESTASKKIIPRRAYKSNPRDGLTMTLFQKRDISDKVCPWTQETFRVVIHSPGDFPRVGEKFISIPINQEIVISVKAVMMTTSPELKKYPVATRQCFFNSDRSLKYFKYYSQSNCEFECLTNFTLLACGCVRVTMPRDNSTKVCNQDKWHCIGASEHLFHMKSLDDVEDWKIENFKNNYGFGSEKVDQLLSHSCDCFPSCFSLNYEVTTLPILLNDEQRQDVDPEVGESDVMIYFEDVQFLKTKRSEIYGWGDFIANCGGLLGLFMGVSILSIIEIIYFATLRLACSLKVPDNKIADEELAFENTETLAFGKKIKIEFIDWDKF